MKIPVAGCCCRCAGPISDAQLRYVISVPLSSISMTILQCKAMPMMRYEAIDAGRTWGPRTLVVGIELSSLRDQRRIITDVIGQRAEVGRINTFPTNYRTCPGFSGGGSAGLLAHLTLDGRILRSALCLTSTLSSSSYGRFNFAKTKHCKP
jgi:hypothetical protein